VLADDGEIETVRVLDTIPVNSTARRFMQITGSPLP